MKSAVAISIVIGSVHWNNNKYGLFGEEQYKIEN